MDNLKQQTNTECFFRSDKPLTSFFQSSSCPPDFNFTVIFRKTSGGKIPNSKPQLLHSELFNIFGEDSIVYYRYDRQGRVIIQLNNFNAFEKSFQVRSLQNVETETIVRTEEFTSRFLLQNIATEIPLSEIVSEIESNNLSVIEARRFYRSTGTERILSESILITIFGTSLPDFINIWHQRTYINLFVDRPRQCKTCWRFDHATSSCNRTTLCELCGNTHHSSNCTADSKKCRNCGDNHSASSSLCPKYCEEVEFLQFKCLHHLSYFDARQSFSKRTDNRPLENKITIIPPKSSTNDFITKEEFHKEIQKVKQSLKEEINTSIADHFVQYQTSLSRIEGLLDKSIKSNPPADIQQIISATVAQTIAEYQTNLHSTIVEVIQNTKFEKTRKSSSVPKKSKITPTTTSEVTDLMDQSPSDCTDNPPLLSNFSCGPSEIAKSHPRFCFSGST